MSVTHHLLRLREAQCHSLPGLRLPSSAQRTPREWIEAARAHAAARGIRIVERKRETIGHQWSRSLGAVIKLAKGFWSRPRLSQAFGLAHELHHANWQLSYARRMPVVRWIARYLTSRDFRYVVEFAAAADTHYLYGLLSAVPGDGAALMVEGTVARMMETYKMGTDGHKAEAARAHLLAEFKAGRRMRDRTRGQR